MKLGYTILYVADPTRTIEFYERAFGLVRRMVTPDGSYGELETGATTLGFASHAHMKTMLPAHFRAPLASDAPTPFELALVTDDVAAAQAQAVAAGATALMPPTVKPWGQTVAYVRDCDGNFVELCTPIAD